jgi:predicted secreted Zn-dependent protease
MLALSRELAELDVQLDAAAKESAQQRRRIETHRLTIGFTVPNTEAQIARIGGALQNRWNSFDEGVADALEYLGYGVAFLALGLRCCCCCVGSGAGRRAHAPDPRRHRVTLRRRADQTLWNRRMKSRTSG